MVLCAKSWASTVGGGGLGVSMPPLELKSPPVSKASRYIFQNYSKNCFTFGKFLQTLMCQIESAK